jgi:hypothetical protein
MLFHILPRLDCFKSYLCWTVSLPTSVSLFQIVPLLYCFTSYLFWTVPHPTYVGLFQIFPLWVCFTSYLCWTVSESIFVGLAYIESLFKTDSYSPSSGCNLCLPYWAFLYRLSLALFNVTSVGLFPIPPLLDCSCL